jgi:hypothetical protein
MWAAFRGRVSRGFSGGIFHVLEAWVHVGCGGGWKPSLFAVGVRYWILVFGG